ncbi:MAG: hypothetical protein ACLQVL_25120 [Terriglobia bacterium]
MRTADSGFEQLTGVYAAAAIAVLGIPGPLFWPYFAGAMVLAIGLPIILIKEVPQAHGLDKILPFGRLFYTVPMAVFAAQHFTATRFIVFIVPASIPAHRFWVLLVGVALFAAALAIMVKRVALVAATLLGIMLLLFVVLIHIPNVVANPGDRFAWAVALRDIAFSGGAFAFAGTQARASHAEGVPWLVTIGRFFNAVPAVFFSVEHFLHPEYIPGVPLDKVTLAWVPGRILWSYIVGAVLFAAGASIMLMKKARLAATCLGVVIFLLTMFVYLPTLVARPSDIANELNYFVDTLLFSGAALLLADALPKEDCSQTPALS